MKPRPSLIAVSDVARYGLPATLARLEALCSLSAPERVLVQLRDRALPARTRYAIGLELRELTRRYGQLLAINDRVDLALAVRADGVHLAEQSMSATEARALLGPTQFISCACHRPAELGSDRYGPADGLLLSPVFAERKGARALGPGALEEAKRRLEVDRPEQQIYALGGVDAASAERCAKLGMGVAAIGAVFDADDVTALVTALGIGRV